MSDFSLHPYDLTFPWLLKVGRNDAFGMVQWSVLVLTAWR